MRNLYKVYTFKICKINTNDDISELYINKIEINDNYYDNSCTH